MFYQILKGVYTSNLFETYLMVGNDDLKGKTTHFTGFYTYTISGPKSPKTAHARTYLQLHYSNGVFGNLSLPFS